MRSRILSALAALMFGLLGVAAAASPAQATPAVPVVGVNAFCGGSLINLDPNDWNVPWRIKVDGKVEWSSDGNVGEPTTVDVPAGDVAVEVKLKGEWKPYGQLLEWKLPGWCKPIDVDVELPTCKCLDLIVTVKNPNGKGWLWVRVGDDKPVKLTAGESTTVKVRAGVAISAGWNPAWLKVVKELSYKAPECASPSPSPSPSPTPTGGPEATPTPVVTTPAMSPSPLPSVVPAGQTGGEDRLPTTGASVTGVVIAGVALLAGGIFLLVWLRRRNPGRHFAA
jgi:LPXTG-motif cell wall-anchored protein